MGHLRAFQGSFYTVLHLFYAVSVLNTMDLIGTLYHIANSNVVPELGHGNRDIGGPGFNASRDYVRFHAVLFAVYMLFYTYCCVLFYAVLCLKWTWI